MKRLIWILALAAVLPVSPAQAQAPIVAEEGGYLRIQYPTLFSATSGDWIEAGQYGVNQWALAFVYRTAPSAVTIALQCSNDGATAASTIASSTSTTPDTQTGSATCRAVRPIISGLTGAIAVDITVTGVSSIGASLGSVTVSGSVTVTDGAGAMNVICDSGCAGGTQYTEGNTDASITGTALLMEGAADTLVAAPGTTANGLLVDVSRVTGTVTVGDGAGALNVIVDSGALTATVTDGAGALNVIVDSGTVTVSDGAGALNVICDSGCTGGTQYTEDAAAAADPVGTALILVRDDTPGALVSGDGDNVAARGGNFGNMYVTLVDSAGAFIATSTGGAGTVDANTGRVTIATDDDVSDAATLFEANLVAHDISDAGNPLKIGGRAVSFGATPTAVGAADRTDFLANRAGVPFVQPGHPNIVSAECQVQDADGALSDQACVSVSAGTKIVVLGVAVHCDGSTTAPTNVAVGFGTTTLPARVHTGVAGILAGFDGVPAGGGMVKGFNGGIVGVGADDEDVRYTIEDPAGGNCSIEVSYYTIAG